MESVMFLHLATVATLCYVSVLLTCSPRYCWWPWWDWTPCSRRRHPRWLLPNLETEPLKDHVIMRSWSWDRDHEIVIMRSWSWDRDHEIVIIMRSWSWWDRDHEIVIIMRSWSSRDRYHHEIVIIMRSWSSWDCGHHEIVIIMRLWSSWDCDHHEIVIITITSLQHSKESMWKEVTSLLGGVMGREIESRRCIRS
jgi:hypothetical protein